ncbi:hypothetical protein FKM82_028534 [Ascaphus truei]
MPLPYILLAATTAEGPTTSATALTYISMFRPGDIGHLTPSFLLKQGVAPALLLLGLTPATATCAHVGTGTAGVTLLTGAGGGVARALEGPGLGL